jgi:mRNA interferase MazF
MNSLFPKRGEIWLANFNPAHGSEQKGMRPALIIQNDIGNEVSPITIVAAISTVIKEYPINVMIKTSESGLTKDSVVKLNQIRTIDKKRLIKRLGKLGSSKMNQVNSAIVLSLGLTPCPIRYK